MRAEDALEPLRAVERDPCELTAVVIQEPRREADAAPGRDVRERRVVVGAVEILHLPGRDHPVLHRAQGCRRAAADHERASVEILRADEILRRKGLLDIDINDFELNFPHGETANVQSKAQAFQTLMAAGLHPELAAEKSGISSDPVKDMKMSEEYLRMIWGDPSAVNKAEQTDGGQGEAEIVESDNDNGENDTGGAV